MAIDDDLTNFRTTWLRSIAFAWVDSGFRGRLEADPIQAMKDEFGLVWPWQDVLSFSIKQAREFVWVGDNWTWPHGKEQDTLTLYVPLSNAIRKILPKEHARALAEYYAEYPSLFGKSNLAHGSSDFDLNSLNLHPDLLGALSMAAAAPRNKGPVLASMSAPPGGFFPSQSSFLDFQVALLSVMAKAWENANFARVITESPLAALNSIRDYTLPWNLTLRIADDVTAEWLNGRWKTATMHHLELCIPERPAEGRDQTIALASYNSTGACYPFTCCA